MLWASASMIRTSRFELLVANLVGVSLAGGPLLDEGPHKVMHD